MTKKLAIIEVSKNFFILRQFYFFYLLETHTIKIGIFIFLTKKLCLYHIL